MTALFLPERPRFLLLLTLKNLGLGSYFLVYLQDLGTGTFDHSRCFPHFTEVFFPLKRPLNGPGNAKAHIWSLLLFNLISECYYDSIYPPKPSVLLDSDFPDKFQLSAVIALN